MDIFTMCYLALALVDFGCSLVMLPVAWRSVSRDRTGPYKQRQASWWLAVVAGVVYPLIRILNGTVLLLIPEDERALARNCELSSVAVKILLDVANLLGTQWHWRTLRPHASRRRQRLVTIFSEILTCVWAPLVIVTGAFKIKSKLDPPLLSRSLSSPQAKLALVTVLGLPLVNYIPLHGLLIAWTKYPDFRFKMKDINDNPWAMSFLLAVVLHTGVNTWLNAFLASAFGFGLEGQESKRVTWLCLQASSTGLGLFIKYALMDNESGSLWIYSRASQQDDMRDEHVEKSQEGV